MRFWSWIVVNIIELKFGPNFESFQDWWKEIVISQPNKSSYFCDKTLPLVPLCLWIIVDNGLIVTNDSICRKLYLGCDSFRYLLNCPVQVFYPQLFSFTHLPLVMFNDFKTSIFFDSFEYWTTSSSYSWYHHEYINENCGLFSRRLLKHRNSLYTSGIKFLRKKSQRLVLFSPLICMRDILGGTKFNK